jgi:hypothetical protein
LPARNNRIVQESLLAQLPQDSPWRIRRYFPAYAFLYKLQQFLHVECLFHYPFMLLYYCEELQNQRTYPAPDPSPFLVVVTSWHAMILWANTASTVDEPWSTWGCPCRLSIG